MNSAGKNIKIDENPDFPEVNPNDTEVKLVENNFPILSLAMISGTLKEGFIEPGFKVRDRIGGPHLIVIGFTYSEDTISIDGNVRYKSQIYKKVFINPNRLSNEKLCGGHPDEKYVCHYFTNIWDTWEKCDIYTDEFFIVCKYWDISKTDFRYILKDIFEIESI